jgi:bacteriocin-like protein
METNNLIVFQVISFEEMKEISGGSELTYWICYGLGKLWRAYEESMSYNQVAASSAQ